VRIMAPKNSRLSSRDAVNPAGILARGVRPRLPARLLRALPLDPALGDPEPFLGRFGVRPRIPPRATVV
jgi:hypothetical protein